MTLREVCMQARNDAEHSLGIRRKGYLVNRR